MLEKIFELADKCDKKDTSIEKEPHIYPDGRVNYCFGMDLMPWSEESEKAQEALIDFLHENCLSSEEGFLYFICYFDGFEVEIDYYD